MPKIRHQVALKASAAVRQSETREVRTSSAPRVKVENDAGLIEVSAWERDYIEVEAAKYGDDQEGIDRLLVEVSGGPDDVLVTYTSPGTNFDAWVDFRVKCPRGAALDLHNASGEVLVSGFYGASRASTASGTIRAARMRGNATLTSASGAITGAALEGTVYARSASGDIVLHGHLGGGHRLETASGNIEVDAVDGTMDARSASGSIRAVGRFTGESRLRTVSGDMDVKLLAGTDVSIQGSTRAGALNHPGGNGMLILETTSGEIRVEDAG